MNSLCLCSETQVIFLCRQILEEEAGWWRRRRNGVRIAVYNWLFALQAYSHHQCEVKLINSQ